MTMDYLELELEIEANSIKIDISPYRRYSYKLKNRTKNNIQISNNEMK